MRILICSSFFPPYYLGGAELVAYKQAQELKRLGHDVRVFCGRLTNHLLRTPGRKVDKGAFHTTRVSMTARDISGTTWDFRSDGILQEGCRVLDEFSPEIVHFHNLVGLSLRLIDECDQRRIPTVMTLHDYWGICFKNTLLKNDGSVCTRGGLACLGCREVLSGDLPLPTPVRYAHFLLALRKVSRFISPSRYLAEQYTANGIPREKIAVIKNGIDLAPFTPQPRRHGPFTVGFIGHLGEHKGLDILLHALSRMDDPKPRLLVIGTGEEEGALKNFCHELDLDHYVTFAGHVDNQKIATVYQKIDVLVVPSVWPENSPVTITEAMASGIPVIASDIGGIPELVEDGVTGFLVPVRDSHAMAERIARLLERPQLKQDMGQAALARIQPYRLQNQVEQIVGIYQEVVAPRVEPAKPTGEVLLYDAPVPWNMALREMFQRVAEVEEKLVKRLLIGRVDLSDDDSWDVAKLLVIPTLTEHSVAYALRALHRQIPILVPEEAEELRDLCLVSNGGLFYGNSEELKECLLLLLSDDGLRQRMGSNGQRFIREARTPAAVSPELP